MSTPTVMSIENLGKKYKIHHQSQARYASLRDVLSSKARELMGRRDGGEGSDEVEDFWALKDVSCEIKQGEVFGIVGRNGAGKSTLLKVLSRITEPTTGRVRIKGRIASLLEVGTGFHHELTGRENIFLNGAILGMSREEIRRKFDEIVEFAQVEQFLDTPVKFYSSGMYVRLAFGVASHLEPEILVIDEVLAVGDAQFQAKCLGKMEDVARNKGRTVLFVSHNIPAIRALCSRAILLAGGKLVDQGDTDRIVNAYAKQDSVSPESVWTRPSKVESRPAYFQRVEATLSGKQPRMTLLLKIGIRCVKACPKAFMTINICDLVGTAVFQAIPVATPFMEFREGNDYEALVEIDLPALIPGRYSVDLWMGSHYASEPGEAIDSAKGTVAVAIDESPVPDRTFPHSQDDGAVIVASRCDFGPLPLQ